MESGLLCWVGSRFVVFFLGREEYSGFFCISFFFVFYVVVRFSVFRGVVEMGLFVGFGFFLRLS